MDLHVLRYYVTVCEEKSIVKAASLLHLTQPTLSRQLKNLEEEFGSPLFERGNRAKGIVLTEKGGLLYRRALELLELSERTETEMKESDSEVQGIVSIGCGESETISYLAKASKELKQSYPKIKYNLFSGNAEDVKEKLEKGLLDFAVFIGKTNLTGYESLLLPKQDRWGLLLRKDHPLAKQKSIHKEELKDFPLLISRRSQNTDTVLGIPKSRLNIVGTYNLIFNAALFAREGFAGVLSLDRLVNTETDSELTFVPFSPEQYVDVYLTWKESAILSKASKLFLEQIKKDINH